MRMDLESENSALESVEDNENLFNFGEVKVESNGNCVVDEKDNGNVVREDSKKSPSPSPGVSKGYGLKKWRRIKRDLSKEGVSNVGNSKLLKRGLPNAGADSNRAMQFSGGVKQNSEGSVSSVNSMMRSPASSVDLFGAIGNSGIGNVVGTWTDSENSEDQSDKSSTAASAPKMMYEMPLGNGFASEKKKTRNLRGKNLVHSGQRVQPGKIRNETSRKLRGYLIKIEKENSHSSMESDSRSSHFIFMQGINSATGNGRQSGRSRNYDGENSDGAEDSERQPSEELPGGDFEDNFREDLAADSSWGIKEEKSGTSGPSSDQDPLFESIITLQTAEEALEKEIQKFKEIGKEENTTDCLVRDDSAEQLKFGDFGGKFFDSSKSEVISLKQNMNLLESKLDDATAMLKTKEAQLVELQECILRGRSVKVETGCALELHQENYRGIEIELEGLFKQKIEAEVEYLAISRTVQRLRVAVVDQVTVLEEQKNKQYWMLNELGDAEVKAPMLDGEAAKLENCCEDIVNANEHIKLTIFFIIQLVLFLIAVVLYLQLSSKHFEIVPT